MPSRRLSAAHGPRPHFYSSLDEMLGHERKHGRHLQDEETVSYLSVNALATSGDTNDMTGGNDMTTSEPTFGAHSFIHSFTRPIYK